MPRKPRSHVVAGGNPLHVIIRGNNRRTIFSYPSDYRRFLGFLADALATTGCRAHAIALMRNHVHLVLTPPDVRALSGCMQRTEQRYAVYRNDMLGNSGKLFEERYEAITIEGEPQLALTLAYVDRNPVRAGMVPSPREYRWSTYRLQAGEAGADPDVSRVWTPHDWYLGLAADGARRGEAYRAWVKSRLADDLEKLAAAAHDADDDVVRRPRVTRPNGSRAH